MKLYHYSKGFPSDLKLNLGTLKLRYTKHALQAAKDDGIKQLPTLLYANNAFIVEVETDSDDFIEKVLYRIPYNHYQDLCLAVRPDGTVKTVYLNDRYDAHVTLNSWRYCNVIRGV